MTNKIEKIIENGLNALVGYDELKNGQKFIYVTRSSEWFAVRINEQYAAFINGCNHFILARKFKNMLSIGSGSVYEYATYEEAEKKANSARDRSDPIIF